MDKVDLVGMVDMVDIADNMDMDIEVASRHFRPH